MEKRIAIIGAGISGLLAWEMEGCSNILNHLTEVYQVNFLSQCVGQFGDCPNIPKFPPNKVPEAFHGKVIPSMEYAAMDYESVAEFVKRKRGSGSSPNSSTSSDWILRKCCKLANLRGEVPVASRAS
ncbi:hypothetical protein Pint_34115 [Pistacia integerrima]|uniref:Uncharacterized protein n=1 Tax=Pistacia integerrima TaxID=434235 RepID=A0ACC0X5N9_9ROSI|nr:hypothetical protein Pint_34115 [Pistacia integerrima]